ncbi:hypothetical protein [Dactylosporangium sp. CA-233914]|uniref:hypothetical protein n=1 Tax=Dactylosporangium sp. CA-233914 TaxID=3239934 RepID=UPI003D92006E
MDCIAPVPGSLFDGYRVVRAIDDGFAGRRELGRLYGYLAVVAVDGEDRGVRGGVSVDRRASRLSPCRVCWVSRSSLCSTGGGATRCGCSTSGWRAAPSSLSPPPWGGMTSCGWA